MKNDTITLKVEMTLINVYDVDGYNVTDKYIERQCSEK